MTYTHAADDLFIKECMIAFQTILVANSSFPVLFAGFGQCRGLALAA